MSKQLSFIATGQDEQDLRAAIDNIGLLAIPSAFATGDTPEPRPLSDFTPRGGAVFFYLFPSDGNPVEIFHDELTNEPSRSKVMPDTSPVIEFAFCDRNGSRVAASRIYFSADRSTSALKIASQKYDKLARFIRKWPVLAQPRPIHVGPATLEMARNGEIELLDGPHRLDPK